MFDTISRSSSNMGYVGSKTTSLGQMFLNLVHPLEASFASIFMKVYQNVFLDDILVRFEYGSCWVKN